MWGSGGRIGVWFMICGSDVIGGRGGDLGGGSGEEGGVGLFECVVFGDLIVEGGSGVWGGG